MRQQNSDSPRGFSFSFCSIIEVIIFIVAIVILQIPMLYVAGSETYYTQEKHPLDSIFQQPAYQKIKNTLSTPKEKYVHLYGEKDSGIISFIRNYASEIKQKKPVIIREYSDDEFQAIYAAFRLAKSIVEDQINLEQDSPKIFILFCFSGQIPKSEIQHIQVNPQDRIITVTSRESKIKGFKNIKFPSVKVQKLQNILVKKMQMDQQIAKILISHYQNVPEIFDNLNQNYFSLENHLGSQYVSLASIDETSKQILQQLCKTGQVAGQSDSLKQIGVIFQNNRYYWESDKTMLNYQIQEKVECKDEGIATQQILQDYDNLHDDQNESVQGQVIVNSKQQQNQQKDQKVQENITQANKQEQQKDDNRQNKSKNKKNKKEQKANEKRDNDKTNKKKKSKKEDKNDDDKNDDKDNDKNDDKNDDDKDNVKKVKKSKKNKKKVEKQQDKKKSGQKKSKENKKVTTQQVQQVEQQKSVDKKQSKAEQDNHEVKNKKQKSGQKATKKEKVKQNNNGKAKKEVKKQKQE